MSPMKSKYIKRVYKKRDIIMGDIKNLERARKNATEREKALEERKKANE